MPRLHIEPHRGPADLASRALSLTLTAGLFGLGLWGCGEEEAPPPPPAPPTPLEIAEFGIAGMPEEVDADSRVTLEWSVSGAARISIWQTPGGELANFEPAVATGTLASRPINDPTQFTLTATAPSGEAQQSTVMVGVRGISIAAFEAEPPSIPRGSLTTLEWTIGGRRPSLLILRDSTGAELLSSTSGERTGRFEVRPQATETYTLFVQGGPMMITRDVTVEVTPASPQIRSFTAWRGVGGMEEQVTAVPANTRAVQLRWEVRNADEVRILGDGAQLRGWNEAGARPEAGEEWARGTFRVSIEDMDRTFTLEARGPAPEELSSESLTLRIAAPPTIESFEVTPLAFETPTTLATAAWEVQNADTITLEVGGTPAPMFPGTPTGTYEFEVSQRTGVVLTARGVDVVSRSVTIELGYDDREPNDAVGDAIALSTGGQAIRGTVRTSTDADTYSVTLPGGSSLFARLDAPPMGDCASLGATLALLDGAGRELGQSSRAYDGACAAILGPEDAAFAEDLAPGTYYVQVRGRAGPYALAVTDLRPVPELPDVSVARQGNPPWEVRDFIHVPIPFGPAPSFSDLQSVLTDLAGLRHFVGFVQQDGFLGPSTAALLPLTPPVPGRSDFSIELRTMAALLELESKNSFSAAEYQTPNGLVLGMTVVPSMTATIGASSEAPMPPFLPILPNALFPINIDQTLIRGGMNAIAPPNGVFLGPAASFAGRSHVHLFFFLGEGLLSMPPSPSGLYEWRVLLVDSNNMGYTVQVPFRFAP